MSASCVTISNPDLLSRSETGVNLGIRSWEKRSSEWARCQKGIGGIYFTEKWRAESPQPGLEFDNFKPRLESCIFKCISWLNSSFFEGNDRGFLEDRSQDLSNGTYVAHLLLSVTNVKGWYSWKPAVEIAFWIYQTPWIVDFLVLNLHIIRMWAERSWNLLLENPSPSRHTLSE